MPGMSLSLDQVARLCGMDARTCQSVLDALVDARFLYVTTDGAYVRITGDAAGTHRPPVGFDDIGRRRTMRRAS